MTPADVARMIGQAETAGVGYYTEWLRPVARGELNVMAPMRDTPQPPFYRLGKQGRPVIALVGDDDYQPAGPATWASAARLRAWAAFAIVHGAGAKREHYEMAAVMAKQVRRLLFVETTSEAAQEWAGFLSERTPKLPFMGVLPNDGPHPIAVPKGAVH